MNPALQASLRTVSCVSAGVTGAVPESCVTEEVVSIVTEPASSSLRIESYD